MTKKEDAARDKLLKSIEQAKARLQLHDARASKDRRKQETRGAIVFSGYAAKVSPELLDRAITELESRSAKNKREEMDLAALIAFRERGRSDESDSALVDGSKPT